MMNVLNTVQTISAKKVPTALLCRTEEDHQEVWAKIRSKQLIVPSTSAALSFALRAADHLLEVITAAIAARITGISSNQVMEVLW
jgi:hypothetical protein